MNCRFDDGMANGYKSSSQIIRFLTESWMEANMYCPRCGSEKIVHFPNNRAVADFYCPVCNCQYELKSKSGAVGNRIADGAYDTFIQRITSNDNPDFFVLSYDRAELCVDNLWIVPKHFFVPGIVEKRRPLADTAQRAGWIGCNIIFSDIPVQGRIGVIQNRNIVDKELVMDKLRQASLLHTDNLDARGWLMDILNCVNEMQDDDFTLDEIYRFSQQLKIRHPGNNNIQPKIRQQLQILRDRGFIKFVKPGHYRRCLN